MSTKRIRVSRTPGRMGHVGKKGAAWFKELVRIMVEAELERAT